MLILKTSGRDRLDLVWTRFWPSYPPLESAAGSNIYAFENLNLKSEKWQLQSHFSQLGVFAVCCISEKEHEVHEVNYAQKGGSTSGI